MIDKKDIEKVLYVNIEEIVSRFVTLKRTGSNFKACCPFHSEKTPSFIVSPSKNMFKCFGCGKSGNGITFVMEHENISFPAAVKYIAKEHLHLDIEDDHVLTEKEKEDAKHRESLLNYLRLTQEYFAGEINKEYSEAKTALSYAQRRWPPISRINSGKVDFCSMMGIGWAPSGDNFIHWVNKMDLKLELLEELGLIRHDERNPDIIYPFFKGRVTIPIRDRYSNVIGFTARTLDDNNDRKYINSTNSIIYSKSESIFGINYAMSEGRRQRKMYLVEGAPDVLRLESLDINNVIASLGGEWTENQLLLLQHLNVDLCFIPDSDGLKRGERIRKGEQFVLNNGTKAMKMGFTVSVREIPNEDKDVKQDPDSYITSQSIFNSMEEREFILWYAGKLYNENGKVEEQVEFRKSVCDLIVCIKDEEVQDSYLTKLKKVYDQKGEWNRALLKSRKDKLSEEQTVKRTKEYEALQKYGFTERNNCYYGDNGNGKEKQWSNFVMRPLFHIKDDTNPVRLFEILCENQGNNAPKEIVSLNMDELNTPASFRKKMGGLGNYIWMVKEEELIKLWKYLFDETDTAIEIKQLGWQKEGFWAFCNGIFDGREWMPIDEMGIVHMQSGNYYLPAMSLLNRKSTNLYVNERRFIYTDYSKITMMEYFRKIIKVFGINGKVGILFYIATLYKDVFRRKINYFPILNVFGKPGSGKTEFADTLMSFFVTRNEAADIGSTKAALEHALGSVSNALVHIDEYKNSIHNSILEMLKNTWGGRGREKMDMDKDKKRTQSNVDCGVILTGQEIPTADPALFTRLIYLETKVDSFTDEQSEALEDLQKFRMLGVTHITIEALKYRQEMEKNIPIALDAVSAELKLQLRGITITDRIRDNWKVPLAAYQALSVSIELPFTYEEILKICVEGIKYQNSLGGTVDDLANFWDNIKTAIIRNRELRENQDYKIVVRNSIDVGYDKHPDIREFDGPKSLLLLRFDSANAAYRRVSITQQKGLLPKESLVQYLKNSTEYIGKKKDPDKWCNFLSPNDESKETRVVYRGKETVNEIKYYSERPMVFDFALLKEKYDLSIDGCIEFATDKEGNKDTSEYKTDRKEEIIPFEKS